ncbi:MAG: hypothetical protein ACRDHZ_10155, partial [Ktedonobacteraceae bacterium]
HGHEHVGLQQAIATFWLLTQLGGIGSRSRRCGGSLAVQAVQNDLTTLPFTIAANTQALKSQLERGIQEARHLTKAFHQLEPRSISLATFDILAQKTCRIWILQDERPWSSAEEAVRELGTDLQDYRSHISPIGRREIFGLPLPRVDSNKRHASPLLLHVAELQKQKYVGIAVLFKTTESDGRPDDYTLIEKWIDNFCGKREVLL